MTQNQIKRRLERIKVQLNTLGPMHPGSISEQYNVCGTPGCRCKDPKRPRKHGPYYQLSYTWRRRSTSCFVRGEQLAPMRKKVANYKRFRDLMNTWVDLSIELERLERAATKKSHEG